MKHSIYIILFSVLLASCNSFNKKPATDLIKFLEEHPDIKYLETNLDILKVNETYYCDLIETDIECLTQEQVQDVFSCTKDELDKAFELVRKSGAFAIEKNEKGQVIFAKGGFMTNFNGYLYSPVDVDLNSTEYHFVSFYILNIEKEDENWYKVN